MRTFASILLVASALTAACDGPRDIALPSDSASAARQPIPPGISPTMVEWRTDGVLVPSPDSLKKLPGYIVDSVFAPAEALRRFQAAVAGPVPTRLTGGAPDAETLLRRYWSALIHHDTAGVRSLVVSRGEFAYIYLPESAIFASGMQPSAAWVLYEAQTGRGLSRAWRAAGSGDTSLVATTCRDRTRDEGKSHTYGPCAVIRRKGAAFDTLWIAGTVVRRDGVHKLLGLDNQL